MRISNITIKNFRLLEDISLKLEDDITLIVGRNNTGKSSLADLCIDLLEKQNELRFYDFSKKCYQKFKEAYTFYIDYKKSKESKEPEQTQVEKRAKVEDTLPKIVLEIHIEYKKGDAVSLGDNLTALSKFIMDLDVKRNDALILIEYSVNDSTRLFSSYEETIKTEKIDLIEYLNNNLENFYGTKTYAVDKNKREYKRLIESKNDLSKVFLTRSIVAQRSVDDNSKDSKKSLGKGFERYYKNTKPDENKKKIEETLNEISKQLDRDYNNLFKNILEDLSKFGGKTPVVIPEIIIKSILDSEGVLNKNINYFYDNGDGVKLPENYNGLGYSNLIYMVLQFASFFEEFKNLEPKPEFLFIILEEPEAHMHPQMQQVFIKNINKFLETKGTCAQILITTHSSHIMAESGIDEQKGFDRIRYFDKSEERLQVRDLSNLKIVVEEEITKKFLRQYLTLHKCDLFFADKIILVEGPTERMLLPQMIQKTSKSLEHEYISIIETGGAYAHRFGELLEFINVKTLIITDIDSIDPKNNRKACPVLISKEQVTSNAVLKAWLPKKEKIDELLLLDQKNKFSTGEKIRVAYQIPEIKDGKCGRSLEESLIIKNAGVFSKNKELLSSKDFFDLEEKEIIEKSYQITEDVIASVKKTGFTFDLLIMSKWDTPLYIKEGLEWLETKGESKDSGEIKKATKPLTAKAV